MTQNIVLVGDSYVVGMTSSGWLKSKLAETNPNVSFSYYGKTGYRYGSFNDSEISEIVNRNPSLIIVHLGINDAGFFRWQTADWQKEQIRGFYNKLHNQLPNTQFALITPTHIKHNDFPDENIDKMATAIRDVASELGLNVYDMNRDRANYFKENNYIISDNVHLTRNGYQKYEEFIFGYINGNTIPSIPNVTMSTVIDASSDCERLLNNSTNFSDVPLDRGRTRDISNIDEIIIHCTATHEGQSCTVEDIDSWHKARGWSGIGYHFVVYLDGSVHNGRDINRAGAHTEGHNTRSIGICYVGGLERNNMNPKDTRTDAQKASLLALVKRFKREYPNATVHGHREFAQKECPCFDARAEYANV